MENGARAAVVEAVGVTVVVKAPDPGHVLPADVGLEFVDVVDRRRRARRVEHVEADDRAGRARRAEREVVLGRLLRARAVVAAPAADVPSVDFVPRLQQRDLREHRQEQLDVGGVGRDARQLLWRGRVVVEGDERLDARNAGSLNNAGFSSPMPTCTWARLACAVPLAPAAPPSVAPIKSALAATAAPTTSSLRIGLMERLLSMSRSREAVCAHASRNRTDGHSSRSARNSSPALTRSASAIATRRRRSAYWCDAFAAMSGRGAGLRRPLVARGRLSTRPEETDEHSRRGCASEVKARPAAPPQALSAEGRRHGVALRRRQQLHGAGLGGRGERHGNRTVHMVDQRRAQPAGDRG